MLEEEAVVIEEAMKQEGVGLEVAVEQMVVVFSVVISILEASVTVSDPFSQTTSEVLLPANLIPLLHLQMKKCMQFS